MQAYQVSTLNHITLSLHLSEMTANLRQQLIDLAKEAGAQRVGFASAGDVDATTVKSYNDWLDAGNAGDMHYLANYPDIRRNPSLLLDANLTARTVMVCAFSYFHHEKQEPEAAKFAMYAHGSDYHEVLRQRLRPVAQLLEENGYAARICVDSAPMPERYWAQRAGVGFQGRNRLIIVPGMGSYFFLAEIVTNAPIEPDSPCNITCGDCGRCLKACPGGALRAAGGFDSRRCLSYLTIEHRGELPATVGEQNNERPQKTMRDALGHRVYGCDECQRACPHNAAPLVTEIDEFHLRPALRAITREEILSMTQEEFAKIFSHSAVKRAKLTGLQRNAKASKE